MLGMIDDLLFTTVQVVKAALKIGAPHLTGAAGAAGALSAPTGQAAVQVAAWMDAHSPFCHDDCWYTGSVTQSAMSGKGLRQTEVVQCLLTISSLCRLSQLPAWQGPVAATTLQQSLLCIF